MKAGNIAPDGGGLDSVGSRGSRFRPKFLDLLVIITAFGGFVLSAAVIYGGPAPANLVVSNQADEWIYPLSEDRTISVDGPLGPETIVIENGQARVTQSPCKNQICVNSKPVRDSGDWTACLPNGIFMRVEGDHDESEQLDAVVR